MAPEVVANRPREGQTYDGKPADLWSAGVMLYIMLCARFPFERPDDSNLEYQDKLKKVLQRIVNVQYTFPRCAHLAVVSESVVGVAVPCKAYCLVLAETYPVWYLSDSVAACPHTPCLLKSSAFKLCLLEC
jgi:serine/threonine protein kinase